jgi:prepilin-type N-terminal cleavage/methylation domain-containing protein
MWLRKSKKGFTLIELMVVVAIIAVLSLLGLRVYTGQATKARNASVQANMHSLATELGVLILESTNPSYNVTTIENSADNAQITNPFDTAKKGKAVLISGIGTEPGYIYYQDYDSDTSTTGNDAYHLEGINNKGEAFITLDVKYQE